MSRMDDAAIDAALRERPHWRRDGDAIVRTVAAKGFMRPLLLANAIGWQAERANHHPELTIGWGFLTIRLWTHVAGGVTAHDFALADAIDALVADARSAAEPGSAS